MNRNKPELSVVMLCYRSGEQVRDSVNKVTRMFQDANILNYELVLVGNYVEGSDDITPKVVMQLEKENPKVICTAKPKKGWMGWDARSGMELARGDYIAIIDGDGQFPLYDLVSVYRIIKDDNLDLVKTYRVTRKDGLIRKIYSYSYNLLFKSLFPGLNSRDINSKPKIMTRKSYDNMDLKSDDWFIDAEIMIAVRRNGLRFDEISTTFDCLEERASFVNLRTVFEFIKNLIVYRIREFRASSPPGPNNLNNLNRF